MGRTDFLLLGRSYEKGTEGEVTLLCHVTQRRTGTGSPLLAEGHNCLQKPQTDNVLTPIFMLSSNSDEKPCGYKPHTQWYCSQYLSHRLAYPKSNGWSNTGEQITWQDYTPVMSATWGDSHSGMMTLSSLPPCRFLCQHILKNKSPWTREKDLLWFHTGTGCQTLWTGSYDSSKRAFTGRRNPLLKLLLAAEACKMCKRNAARNEVSFASATGCNKK